MAAQADPSASCWSAERQGSSERMGEPEKEPGGAALARRRLGQAQCLTKEAVRQASRERRYAGQPSIRVGDTAHHGHRLGQQRFGQLRC